MANTPSKLQAFSVFADGIGLVAIATCTLPPLNRQTAEVRAGGMNGPVEVDMGMQAITLELAMESTEQELMKLFGAPDISFTIRGSHSARGGEIPDIVNVRGMLKSLEDGQWKAGDDSTQSATITATYYRRTFNGVEQAEIDFINNVEVIGGVDRLAQRRANLGI